MKNVISIVRTVFITGVISLFLLIWWTFYIDGSIGFGGETPSREDRPSMQEVTSLLDDVTKGLPSPNRKSEQSKNVVRAAAKVYVNPTQTTFDTVNRNIKAQNFWKRSEFKEYNKYDYCYYQYNLTIEEVEGFFPNTNTKKELHISVGWTDHDPCRKSYLERLNSRAS